MNLLTLFMVFVTIYVAEIIYLLTTEGVSGLGECVIGN